MSSEQARTSVRSAGGTGLLVTIAIIVLALDQATKYLAESMLDRGVRTPVLGDALGLQLIYNPGAAFSFGTGVTWIFTVAMVGVSIAVAIAARRVMRGPWAWVLGALLGGALGNLTDRLVREPGFGVGHVVDFIAYGNLFIGNVADIAIVLAAVGLGLLSVLGTPWRVGEVHARDVHERDEHEQEQRS